MTRLFYRIEDKMLFDQNAFLEMAHINDIDLSSIYDIFGLDQGIHQNRLIEV